MTQRTAAAALLFVLTAGRPADGQTLTLERAIQDALANNRGLRAASSAADEADARVREARAGYFPRVVFAESWQRGDQPVFVFSSLLSARRFGTGNLAIDALNHPAPVGFFHGLFAVEQVLFDGGRTRAAVRAAASGRDGARAFADAAHADLIVLVTETYGRLLAAESTRRAAASAVEAAREDRARAERRREVGMATDAEVLSLAVHLADVQQRAVQAGGEASSVQAELNRLLGAPIAREIATAEPPPAEAAADRADLAALLAAAEDTRPEVRRAAAALAGAEAGASQARAAWWPQLVAQGAYQVDGTRFSDRASAWIAGGELRWSWSVGGAQVAGSRAAAHAVARARAELEDARAAVQVEVLSALRRLESAEAAETVARTAVEQARESERITRNRYEAGLAATADVLRASTALLDAETRRVSALVGRLHAGAALHRAVGGTPVTAR